MPNQPDQPDLLDQELTTFDDHALLAGGVADAVTENQAAARRWARLVEFFSRRESDYLSRRAQEPHFTLTPRQETVVEISELWGLTTARVRNQLNIALFLHQFFDQVWAWCRTGQLDTYRASVIADAARHQLTQPEEYFRLAERLTVFLTGHLRQVDGVEVPVVNCTVKQLRNKLSYEIRLLRSRDAEERHRKAYAERSTQTADFDDGISTLSVTTSTDKVQRAAHSLTLAAKKLRADGDERTLEQLRADLAIDLLTGTTPGLPAPSFARPVVNVTVPLQSLMGLSDHPGTMGGQVIPASMARRIAAEPDSTWYRLLTDPDGTPRELSTRSYQPTPPIWRQVVATGVTCFRPHCDHPAEQSETDHVIPWPEGETSAANLQPACKADHKAKHAAGFSVDQAPDGSAVFRTAAGFSHLIEQAKVPVENHWPDLPEEIQFTATEFVDALHQLRDVPDTRSWQADILSEEHRHTNILSRYLDRVVA